MEDNKKNIKVKGQTKSKNRDFPKKYNKTKNYRQNNNFNRRNNVSDTLNNQAYNSNNQLDCNDNQPENFTNQPDYFQDKLNADESTVNKNENLSSTYDGKYDIDNDKQGYAFADNSLNSQDISFDSSKNANDSLDDCLQKTDDDLTEDDEHNNQTESSTNMKLLQNRIAKQQDSIVDDKLFMADQFVHPYFDKDPDLGLLPQNYEEPVTLMHGCSSCPQSYKTISKQELNSCEKMHVEDWLSSIKPPSAQGFFDYVEVRFKNSHKDFYKIPEGLEIVKGDIVAVEGTPGHDIGIVSMTGELCRLQMKKKKGFNIENVKKLYRRAKATDIEKWLEVISKEDETLFATRKLALKDNLDMKVNDVEYQGDGTKAIFYYTANDRVDFRQLIKDLAEAFSIKIEMKQIGARQEAGRLGGIGTCGRELCCSTWLNNFTSVGTAVAKAQQLFPNPQKLAGQCGKLKCCLNYEYDVYQDALKDLPPLNVEIETAKGVATLRKTDILKRILWYAYKDSSDFVPISADNVKKMISMNRNKKIVPDLESFKIEKESQEKPIKNNETSFN